MQIGIRKKFILIVLSLLILSNLVIGILGYNISRNQLEENGKWMLRNTVNMAIELAVSLNKEVEEGHISLDEAQKEVKIALLGEKEDGSRALNADVDLGEQGYFFILDEKGVAVAHPSLEGQNMLNDISPSGFYPARDQIEKALNGGGFTYYDWELPYDNKYSRKITYERYYPEWGWIILAGTYMEDFNEGANHILSGLILLLVIFTILASIVVYYISDKISAGIINAAEYSDKIAQNRLNIPDLNYTSSDEVGILISSLNNMKYNLKESYQEVEAYNEEVRSINIDLEEINSQLLKSNKRYADLYNSMNAGFAYHRVIFDSDRKPVECLFEEINDEFSRSLKIERKNIIGKKVSEIFPDIRNGDVDIIEEFADLSLNGDKKNFRYFSEQHAKWFDLNAFSFERGYFAVVFTDITGLMIYQEELRNQKQELLENYERLEADNEEILALNEELESSYNEVNKLNQNMEQMVYLTSRLNLESLGEEEFLNELFYTSYDLIPEAEYGMLFNYHEDKISVINTIGMGLEPNTELTCKTSVEKVMNYEIMSDKIESPESLIETEALEEDQREVFSSIKETITINIKTHQGDKIGIVLCISKKSGEKFSNSSALLLRAFRDLASVFYRLHRQNIIQKKMRTDILIAVVRMLAIHDSYTKNHSENVAQLAREIAEAMNLDDELIEKTYLTGLVHDIGKVLVPFDILNKKGELNEEEFDMIKKHPIWGFETLRDFEGLQDVATYIMNHHERWDGQGYPEGISSEEIPLVSQIITVADAWDAMVSERSYRKAFTEKEAVEELINCRGSHFSPMVVDAFLEYRENSV